MVESGISSSVAAVSVLLAVDVIVVVVVVVSLDIDLGISSCSVCCVCVDEGMISLPSCVTVAFSYYSVGDGSSLAAGITSS